MLRVFFSNPIFFRNGSITIWNPSIKVPFWMLIVTDSVFVLFCNSLKKALHLKLKDHFFRFNIIHLGYLAIKTLSICGQFHLRFTSTFYLRRSQKRKKTLMTWQTFSTFGICARKSWSWTCWWNWPWITYL